MTAKLMAGEMQSGIEAALRPLPISTALRHGCAGGIPYETSIPGIARELMLMAGLAAKPKRQRSASAAETRKELDALHAAASELIKAIEELQKPAITALNLHLSALFGIGGLMPKLRILSADAEHATVPDNLSKTAKRGARPKDQARTIARRAALEYYRLTGEKPIVETHPITHKAYGDWLLFLAEIFRVLNIKAKAEPLAREMAKEKYP